MNHYEGLDGLKTGYTETAGYCITATAKKNNLRLISVVMGEESNKQRNLDTMELLNYGFANYKVDKVLSTKDYLGYLEVKFGKKDKVKLSIKEDIYDLVNILDKNNYSYNLNIKEVKAPIKKGDVVGYVDIYANEVKINTYPITIAEDVNKGNFFDFLFRNINKYIKGTN